jgi:hypothetical protein
MEYFFMLLCGNVGKPTSFVLSRTCADGRCIQAVVLVLFPYHALNVLAEDLEKLYLSQTLLH